MISLARFRGPAAVAAGLLLAIVLLDVGLMAAVGFTGKFLPDGETPTDDGVFRETWSKIYPIVAPPAGTDAGAPAPVGVFFGQSTLGAGVIAARVEELDSLPMRWYNLHGWGGSLNRTRDLVDLAFASDMKPAAVVLCINPYMLVGHHFETEHRVIMKHEGKFLKPWIWTYDNRHVVNHLARLAWIRSRMWLLDTFDFGFLTLYPKPAEPGKAQPRKKIPALTPEQLKAKAEEYRTIGWYDPARYRIDSTNALSLVDIVRASRARGAKVAIILMPEQSMFRRLIPPDGVRCFDEINRTYFPDDPVPIFNLRDRLPDDLFHDVDHASVEGAEPVSEMVAACVRELMGGEAARTKGSGTLSK
jgi:hypothetical protein